METKFNFKSQMCTTVAQSERLLALGLKKDTADMGSVRNLVRTTSNGTREVIFTFTPDNWEANPDSIPRWSLHRLFEMMPENIADDWLGVSFDEVTYYHGAGEEMIGWKFYKTGNVYNCCIDCIEWLIKEGYFNKEYLCEKIEKVEECGNASVAGYEQGKKDAIEKAELWLLENGRMYVICESDITDLIHDWRKAMED